MAAVEVMLSPADVVALLTPHGKARRIGYKRVLGLMSSGAINSFCINNRWWTFPSCVAIWQQSQKHPHAIQHHQAMRQQQRPQTARELIEQLRKGETA